jgi:hypothetical protein
VGRIEVIERQGKGRQQLLDDLKEKRGCWKLKEEALDRTLGTASFGSVYGPVVRQTTSQKILPGFLYKFEDLPLRPPSLLMTNGSLLIAIFLGFCFVS